MPSLFVCNSMSRLQSMSKRQSVKDGRRVCLLQMVWYHAPHILANVASLQVGGCNIIMIYASWQVHPLSNIFGLHAVIQLWKDLGNWHSSLRKKAHTYITQCYKWDPNNNHKVNIAIVKDLLGDHRVFLRDGVDEQVRHMCTLPLSDLVLGTHQQLGTFSTFRVDYRFFYSGPSSGGQQFSEVFATEVPRVTVAVSATVVLSVYTFWHC